MTTFHFIRHATNDLVGNAIAGRKPGVHLNSSGQREAELLAENFNEPITRIFSSPLERCTETAAFFAKKFKLEVQILPALTEIHFGDWTGKTLEELRPREDWKKWNLFRSGYRIPNGELMSEVQARMIGALEGLKKQFQREHIALFSHGDPIRAALCHFLGAPLDLLTRIEISPASVSTIALSDWEPRVVQVNRVERKIR